ncbi:MAG TPA: hypothetical protein VGF96_13125 [Terracidiphilus sp.]|jgi:hypothetical protein
MSKLNPIPTGPEMQSYWLSNRPATLPEMPDAWSASVLATPFGDSIAPQESYSQLAVGRVESATVGHESWMRIRLYLTRDLRYLDFLFLSVNDPQDPYNFQSEWYWIDSSVSGRVEKIHGPFGTTLQVPAPRFLEDNRAVWGNRYPLMCTDRNPRGIDCDHWVIPTAGTQTDHGSWYSVRRDTGQIFRVFTFDTNNPMMLPFLGAYYLVNFASFQKGVSRESKKLLKNVKAGRAVNHPAYWNPLVTQQDVQRAFKFPIASAKCTIEDIQKVLPGFTAEASPKTPLPTWSNKLYIEGWTLGLDLIPWYTRVCYNWTGDKHSKEQAAFVGLGQGPGDGSYLKRMDTCLNTYRTDMPCFEWDAPSESWRLKCCLPPLRRVGLPYPDWLARDNAAVMGQITGNPNFGLQPDQVLSLIAAEMPGPSGELSIFWVWFLDNGVGMLFSEAKYLNSLSNLPQLIDYTLFFRNAPITDQDFSNPCNLVESKPAGGAAKAPKIPGHLTRLGPPVRKA